MDGLELLSEAKAAGLDVKAEGDRLCIRGPKREEALARKLIAHKLVVLSALAKVSRPSTQEILADPAAASNANQSAPKHKTAARKWDQDTQALIVFFQNARARLPSEPFRLTRWEQISDPAKWYATLERDIACGPLGARARMGTLLEDLRRLREYLESS